MTTISHAEKPTTTLRTLERGLRFLEYVAQCQVPPRVKDVAESMDLNITTCYHLSNTLQKTGYLVRSVDGTLRIGGRAGLLHQGMLRHSLEGRDLQPIVAALSARTNETAYLCSFGPEGVIVRTLAEGTHAVKVTGLYVGFSGSEHVRASGKAVLAYLDEGARNQILAHSMASLTPLERAEAIANLDDEFVVIRARGWAFDNRYFQDSVCCVAAPFFQHDGRVAGSVAVSVPAARFPKVEKSLVEAVCWAGGQVSKTLGLEGA